MPSFLCYVGMVISILVFVLFLLDLLAPSYLAPFKNASPMMDVAFVICSLAVGYLSWSTLRQQA